MQHNQGPSKTRKNTYPSKYFIKNTRWIKSEPRREYRAALSGTDSKVIVPV